MSVLITAGFMAALVMFVASEIRKWFLNWQMRKLMQYNEYFQRYMAYTQEQTIQRHTALVVGVYAFCPHCFSMEVGVRQDGDQYVWKCSECGSKSKPGPYLSALVGWHRDNYEKEYMRKVEHE